MSGSVTPLSSMQERNAAKSVGPPEGAPETAAPGEDPAVSDEDDFTSLRNALVDDVDPRTGKAVFSLPVALALLVFFVFALQCTSTIVVMARETGSIRWPALAFSYMLGLAWLGAFVTHRVASLWLGIVAG